MSVADVEVTVVVVTYRGRRLLPSCLASLRAQTFDHHLIVVDNGSIDGTSDVVADLVGHNSTDRILRMSSNTGFAGAVDSALSQVRTPFCALLNDDAIADPDWLERLMHAARYDEEAAAWTSLMVLADDPGRVNNIGSALDSHWYGIDVGAGQTVMQIPGGTTDVFGFCGGAALLRTEAIHSVGGFPAHFFLYYEDLDTSWRLRREGWTVRCVPSARVVHEHAATTDRGSELFHFFNERNRILMLIRCAPRWVAPLQMFRFLLTTASLLIRRWVLRQPIGTAPNFRALLRMRVIWAVIRTAPAEYARRSIIQRRVQSRLAKA